MPAEVIDIRRKNCVDALRVMLERAEAGEFDSIGIVAATNDGGTRRMFASDKNGGLVRLLGGIQLLNNFVAAELEDETTL